MFPSSLSKALISILNFELKLQLHVFFSLSAWLFGFQLLFSVDFSLYEDPNLNLFFTLKKVCSSL